MCVCEVTLVVSDSLQPCGPQPARLFCPWDSPGKNTGVGCRALLQGIFLTQGSNPHLFHLLHWQAVRSLGGFFTSSPTFGKTLITLGPKLISLRCRPDQRRVIQADGVILFILTQKARFFPFFPSWSLLILFSCIWSSQNLLYCYSSLWEGRKEEGEGVIHLQYSKNNTGGGVYIYSPIGLA